MWPIILSFLSQHWQLIGGLFLYALVAAISTMPAPGHPVHFYEWFYDWSHTLINAPGAARFRVPAVVVPDPLVPHPLPDPQVK